VPPRVAGAAGRLAAARGAAALTASRNAARDLRGASRLAIDATLGVTELVETLHARIARTPLRRGGPAGLATGIVTTAVYRAIRSVTRTVGGGLDALLARLVPLVGDVPGTDSREALVAALNGVLGDHLAESGNPLAIAIRFKHGDDTLELSRDALAASLPHASPTVVLAVHGLCMNDRQWLREGHDHRVALARDLGATAVSMHYNTGLHVSTNGRALAHALEALVAAWPVPVARLIVVGHSMGGLVARSAAHYGARSHHRWIRVLDSLVFLGTPHLGAPLERAGNLVDGLLGAVPWTAPFARLGRLRSAGITDLRHGRVVDDDWVGRDRFARRGVVRHPVPLPAGVACFAIAGSLSATVGGEGRRVRGDGIVTVASALGRHADPRIDLSIPRARCWIAPSTGHLALLASLAVHAKMRDWLTRTPATRASGRTIASRSG
jgi:hypothetical protein